MSCTAFAHFAEFYCRLFPQRQLIYRPCHDGYQCARLLVPMDWNDVDATNNNVAIAVVRLPAKVKITDPRYGGAVIVNPGQSPCDETHRTASHS